MADEARGDWNALYLAPGEASGQALLSDETGGEPAMEAIIAGWRSAARPLRRRATSIAGTEMSRRNRGDR